MWYLSFRSFHLSHLTPIASKPVIKIVLSVVYKLVLQVPSIGEYTQKSDMYVQSYEDSLKNKIIPKQLIYIIWVP